jgi:hypothetical protein
MTTTGAAMPELPAKHLARLKVEHPLWRIRHVCEGFGFEATRGDWRVWAGTVTGLEMQLRDRDGTGRRTPHHETQEARP